MRMPCSKPGSRAAHHRYRPRSHGARHARSRLDRFGNAFVALRGDYRNLRELLAEAGAPVVDGMLFDLGVSSMQLDDPERGFSFQADGPLDMRMDPDTGSTAAELLAELSEEDLGEVLWRFGEERHARRIARAIVQQRRRSRSAARASCGLVERALGPWAFRERTIPRPALSGSTYRRQPRDQVWRIRRRSAIAAAARRTSGLIAFHSLEDRAFSGRSSRCPWLVRVLPPAGVRLRQ